MLIEIYNVYKSYSTSSQGAVVQSVVLHERDLGSVPGGDKKKCHRVCITGFTHQLRVPFNLLW